MTHQTWKRKWTRDSTNESAENCFPTAMTYGTRLYCHQDANDDGGVTGQPILTARGTSSLRGAFRFARQRGAFARRRGRRALVRAEFAGSSLRISSIGSATARVLLSAREPRPRLMVASAAHSSSGVPVAGDAVSRRS
jgi:hypothetical protein